MNQNISFAVYIIPSVITLALIFLITYIIYKNNPNRAILTVIIITLWMFYAYMISAGKFSFHEKLTFIYIPVSGIIIYFSFSRLTVPLLNTIPPEYFIYPQLFRLFTEIHLWLMFINGMAPVQLTFSGMNYDIFIPLTASIIGYFVYSGFKWPELAALFWNIAGIILSLNIALLYISFPYIAQIQTLDFFLYLWPVIFSVPFGILLHLLSVKQILMGAYNKKK